MVTVDQIRTKLQSKIFSPYSKSVTLKHDAGHTYNTRGDISTENWVTSTISLIPYDFSSEKLMYESFSNYVAGDLFAAVPYDTTISSKDRVVIDSDTYEVKEVRENLLPTEAVIIIRLTKIVA
jgi:hypothetical protein